MFKLNDLPPQIDQGNGGHFEGNLTLLDHHVRPDPHRWPPIRLPASTGS